MSDTPQGERHESVSALIATPKSSVWQGFLGAAWVLSSSLLLEVVAKLLEGSVGQSHFLNSLAGVLRWVAVAVVSIAALYVLWRKCMDLRESFRIRRELDLTADLVEPPTALGTTPEIVAEPGAEMARQSPDADPRDPDIAGVLWDLPFGEYESAALYDMVTAMLDCADALPGEHPVAYRDASGVLARLTGDHVVVHSGHDRFQVNKPCPPRDADTEDHTADTGGTRTPAQPLDVRRTPQWRAALPALIRHYADLADRWSVALDSERLGAGAHRWFDGSAERLADLLQECAAFDHGIELDTVALARIADALDIWYARIGVRGCAQTAEAMRVLAGPSHPEIADLAALRCGDLGELPARRSRWRRRRATTGLRARRAHEIALRRLDRYRHPDTHIADPAAAGSAENTARVVVPAPLGSARQYDVLRTTPDAVDKAGDAAVKSDVSVTIDISGDIDAPVAHGALVKNVAVSDGDSDAGTDAVERAAGGNDAAMTGEAEVVPGTDPVAGETGRRRRWSWRRRSRVRADANPLAAAVDGFERAWWLLPRRDVTGEVAALVDLAIAHLYQGRLDAARDRLELAESLTRGGRNPSGRAHTFEILGVLWWMRGEPRRALRWWLLALTRYRDLGHELGICRCLQHLGSAAVVVPGYGGLLLGELPDQEEVLVQAWAWLSYAENRRPDRAAEKSLITGMYRAKIESHLGRTDRELAGVRMRWPMTVSEH
ncbi:hypothetical protein AB0L57_01935 [Nocardia sp. NPDC052254]|uniref:hypothetical protein n=1 Tax=Nocardia sp. NPDC052254 TaxID=3155681 RepID=UPI003436B030